MALKSWLALLKVDVTPVTAVQAPIHACLPCNGIETADVTGVTDRGGAVAGVTAVTAAEIQTSQAKPNIHAGCTLVTAVTCKTIDTESHAVNQLLSGDLLMATNEPKRLFRHRGPWLTGLQALEAKAYHLHHFNCPQCIAAGRGARYGRRCAVGLALWNDYTEADTTTDLQTEGGQHGQA